MGRETASLFPMVKASKARKEVERGAVRLRLANRAQLRLEARDLESMLDAEHAARVMWRLVEALDLSGFLEVIEAREGGVGRDATDPRILVTLWLYASSQGVGSARELARLCEAHDAYRWICGGVTLNHHTLSDFRVGHEEALDELFTQVLSLMMKKGLVELERVAQDGTRVRASAGMNSFKTEPKLEECKALAREQLAHTKKEFQEAGSAKTAARLRAAKGRERRVKEALAALQEVRRGKTWKGREHEARASKTDAEARVMMMGDGGKRPAFNIQLAVTTQNAPVVVGVSVGSIGSDRNEMLPMLEQILKRTGRLPREYLVDSGYINLQAITDAERKGVCLFLPPQARRHGKGAKSYKPKATDSSEVANWRRRMGTKSAKRISRNRARSVELMNAHLKEHQRLRINVRGRRRATCVALWHGLAVNMRRLSAAK